MNLFVWFRARLVGPHDQTKIEVIEEIDRQVSKLNGETEKLSHTVHVIKNDREQGRQAFTDMLDSTLQNPNKDALQ